MNSVATTNHGPLIAYDQCDKHLFEHELKGTGDERRLIQGDSTERIDFCVRAPSARRLREDYDF
ncbi:hypothetical protein Dimus_035326, partial [Dionaea muscipula]